MLNFAEEVRRLREEKGVSQESLAKSCGLTQGAIGHIESGRRSVSGEVLYRLCRALGVSCQHFEAFLAPPAEGPAPPIEKPKRGRPKKEKPEAASDEPATTAKPKKGK